MTIVLGLVAWLKELAARPRFVISVVAAAAVVLAIVVALWWRRRRLVEPQPLRALWRNVAGFIRTYYMTVDPRTLGLFRLILGFLVTADCVRHWKEARWFYSNAGVLTNHYHLFRPSSGYNFSLYHAFSTLGEVHVAFAVSFVCYFCFWIGYRTRIFSILTFLLVTSMDNRLVMVENGGYVVVNLACCWAMFLPLDRRFSVDALLRSYRERRERSVADLNERWSPRWATEAHVSLAMLLATLNFALIYFFNVVNKSGAIWKRGETVHYVLHLDRMVTGLAVFSRELLPYGVTRWLSWGVLVWEALLVTWILAPYGRRVTRFLAPLGVIALNGTFGIMMRLGPFSWFMICWSFLLVTPAQWDVVEALYRRRAAPRVVIYDKDSPLGFWLGRLLARLDRLELLTFEESAEPAPPLLAARTPDGVSRWVDADAAREIAAALPGGRCLWGLGAVLTLGSLGPIVRASSAHREVVSRWLGLRLPDGGRAAPVPEPSPLAESAGRVRRFLREALLVFLGVCATSQALRENKAVPALIREHKQPWVMESVIVTFRLFQGWGMFAPNPITDDGSLTVEAWTLDGRRVDPFTGEEPDLDLTDARGLGLPQIWQDYFNRIRLDRNKVFRQGLREYLLRWHEETGRPGDELVAFDVYWVRDQCPKPGSDEPYDNQKIALLTYRKPGHKQPEGAPAIPPEPKVESAGN